MTPNRTLCGYHVLAVQVERSVHLEGLREIIASACDLSMRFRIGDLYADPPGRHDEEDIAVLSESVEFGRPCTFRAQEPAEVCQ